MYYVLETVNLASVQIYKTLTGFVSAWWVTKSINMTENSKKHKINIL